jgi:hypothetical protein
MYFRIQFTGILMKYSTKSKYFVVYFDTLIFNGSLHFAHPSRTPSFFLTLQTLYTKQFEMNNLTPSVENHGWRDRVMEEERVRLVVFSAPLPLLICELVTK